MYVKAGGVTGICDGVGCHNCMGVWWRGIVVMSSVSYWGCYVRLYWHKSYDYLGRSVSGCVWRDGVGCGCLCQ